MEEPNAGGSSAQPRAYRGPERRGRQPLLYRRDQLLGRAPIRLRRRSDKVRLATHVLAVLALLGLTAWWVLPLHVFAGPVLMRLAAGRGVHLGDLPAILFVALALRSAAVAARLARARLTPTR